MTGSFLFGPAQSAPFLNHLLRHAHTERQIYGLDII